MEKILWSALALAQTLHPIKIISFVIMGNHIHIIALVEDPTNVESFMERFKCESAHAINRLLGRRQITVWAEGYDSPTILTLDDLIEKLAYVYANPVRAHLTDSIGNYHGVSSWKMYTSGEHTKEVKRIRRTFLEPLPSGNLSHAHHQRLADDVEAQSTEVLHFTLSPHAWMHALPEAPSPEILNQKLFTRLQEIEREMAHLRQTKRVSLPSPHEITKASIDTTYTPKSFGRRMWCICRDIPLRIAFISFIKKLKGSALAIRERWRRGENSAPFPPGLFPPCQPMLANLLPRLFHSALSLG
jgi:REP element-mobilizing transposase RayT